MQDWWKRDAWVPTQGRGKELAHCHRDVDSGPDHNFPLARRGGGLITIRPTGTFVATSSADAD